MELKINFHHLESTDAIKSRIQEKSEHLKKFFAGNFKLEWTCEVQGSEQRSHAHLTGKQMDLNASATDSDLYKTFDMVISKLEKQLARQKDQVKDHIHQH
ncbi:MAG: ribosomal subunit interface protein [Halobacteriovoraceae bacterium]|nr:ribosomal subunit interface protein [Halobacteriovoraceae bacterium]|tara:strand:- start:19969 stop:20268 length:300 start_codon:yes stop_codon:yes gene_type:complete